MEISVSLPLDHEGFLRRQCPNCDGVFKWHHGPANAEAEDAVPPASYCCPMCGRPAEPDRWFTNEQAEYIQGVGLPAALREADELLGDAFKGLNSPYLKVTRTGHLDVPAEP